MTASPSSHRPRPFWQTPHSPVEENEKTAAYSFDLRPRVLTVLATERLSETLVRIRFGADDGFESFPFIAPEDHLKLFFDRDEDSRPVLPLLRDGRWSPNSLTYRDYTVRWFDPLERWIDVDFVLHDHGVAGAWAGKAQPGDTLGALGPRGAFLIKDVFPWYVLAADETALPALARWVEGLREGVPVSAYIEVASASSRIPLPSRADLRVHWLERKEQKVGATGLLSEAIINHRYPDREGFIWVAGEAMSIKAARRWISRELKMDRDHWDVDGYWRQGLVNHDHHEEEAEAE